MQEEPVSEKADLPGLRVGRFRVADVGLRVLGLGFVWALSFRAYFRGLGLDPWIAYPAACCGGLPVDPSGQDGSQRPRAAQRLDGRGSLQSSAGCA